MKPGTLLLSALTVLTMALRAQADVLELKNGTILDGKYAGGSAGTIRFESSAGVQVIETSQITALTFTTPATAASTAPATGSAANATAPAPQGGAVTLPAGTTLLVRMMDSISSKNDAGAKFTTKLEYDLGGTGAGSVKGGTIIYGQVQSSTQAGRAVGRSTLDLRLTQMVVGGQPIPIVTSSYKDAGQASIKKAARGAAAGAAIGAIAGDAGQGAAIGATAGALVRGKTVTVPPGTLLEFTLSQPVTINVTN